MTIDELEAEPRHPEAPRFIRTPAASTSLQVYPPDYFPGYMFPRTNEYGQLEFMVLTEDGRWVPAEHY